MPPHQPNRSVDRGSDARGPWSPPRVGSRAVRAVAVADQPFYHPRRGVPEAAGSESRSHPRYVSDVNRRPEPPNVTLYSEWRCLLIEAGPEQAGTGGRGAEVQSRSLTGGGAVTCSRGTGSRRGRLSLAKAVGAFAGSTVRDADAVPEEPIVTHFRDSSADDRLSPGPPRRPTSPHSPGEQIRSFREPS